VPIAPPAEQNAELELEVIEKAANNYSADKNATGQTPALNYGNAEPPYIPQNVPEQAYPSL